MNNLLYYYEQAQKDVKLNSIPHRQSDGLYIPSQGQRKILNDHRYKDLRRNDIEIAHLVGQKNALVKDLLAYETPTTHLETSANEKKHILEIELEEVKTELALKEAELKRKKEDLFNRGVYLPKKDSTSKPTVQKDNKPKERRWKKILSFLGIWLLLELFMTAIQWSSLRDNRSIDEILIRSLALGILLFFFHLISHLNKQQKRVIYSIYLGFDLLMIAVMMFAPPLLYHLYPVENSVPNILTEWSISDNNVTDTNHTQISNPFWVEFYRANEWAPAGASLLFFIVIFFALPAPKDKKTATTATQPQDNIKDETESHIEQGISYMQEEISGLKTKRDELNMAINSLDTNPGDLMNILKQLEAKRNESLQIDKRIADLKVASEALVSDLERELNEYSVEFQDILKNDDVKSSFVAPEWQNRQDIFKYYKIQPI